ncbi:uncharacterized protein GLRG_08955 [Colletotrichum graminicola M1.001]|uniref:DNA mismatch repair protein HSM3 N-terminal domain-containing protein n=1 Tax=Colletotrichum graminicola (strain M1.001 / M2 / FGSC 10212) TaxID=645133 RepID=E3QS72_COLGM|nr:uncharacterized protein GLRG_08955 [Colletotrichum graminicola M1.001]EFQ33811.1 hypothetical protein GLRG_08955 [Colletotrichum graminicola M1.001]
MTDKVVPEMSADHTVPVSGLEELKKHLDELVSAPETPLNPKLLDDVELQLNETNIPPLLPVLLPNLTAILKTTPHDPSPVVSLTIKLLGPVPFTQVLQLADESSLIVALRSPSPSANLLALALLAKAAAAPSDAAILSLMPRVIEDLLRRWLSAPQVEVGERATRVLGDLLDVDCELPPPPATAHRACPAASSPDAAPRDRAGDYRRAPARGRDSDPAADPADLSAHQLSLAQGRVLRILPRLAALNIVEVATSPFPDLTGSADTGLLQLAALHMVDKTDTLMHLNLVDFFETLLSVMRVVDHSHRTMGILKDVVRQAVADDDTLRTALLTLHDRTVPEESDALRTFVRDVMA